MTRLWRFIVWVGQVIGEIIYLIFHPKELKETVSDIRTQAVYHVSSFMTSVSMFLTSLSYPSWARDLAVHGKALSLQGYEYMTTGPGGIYIKEAWKLAREAVSNAAS